ncbi:MAG: SurA N-terminal domain-containing protein, partial [Bacteroidetes bacterium]|nr:SurA N-terminal domain-containing protein [Bacteroidota bacterium]
MSVIQKIRDKYARISVIAIALALLGFILMDAFTGKSNLFRGNSTTLGKVNGTTIDYQDFNKKLAAAEEYRKSQGYPVNGDGARQQLVDQLWQSEVDQTLLSTEFNKLGIDVGVKELNDILFGDNPPQDLRQRFSDPKTGVYDAAQAQQFINQLKKSKNDAEKQQFSQYLQNLEDSRKAEKYTSLLTNSINYPKWFIEQQNAENSEIAKASFVRVPYTSIADSTIKISDDQIQDYINKHKDDYKQQESRSISYVLFNASPNAGDTAAAKKDIESLKDEFAKTDDPAAFLARNGSTLKYADIYIGKSELENANKQMNATNKDTILSLPKGTVYGPYLDGGNFVLAKMIDSKELPDSVKCRHILIGTTDRQGQQLMDDSVAHRLADSIATAIKNGANFDTLETKFSTDEAAHKDKGVMTFPSSQIQSEGFAPEFGKFILFDGKPGDKKVVKTQFGWHYIEILDFIKPEPHYKVAYLGKQINASNETDNAANNMASQFSGDSRSVKSFDANAEKLKAKGYNK